MEISEVFLTFTITSFIGLILAIGRMCYKSKCSTVDLCCLKIVRNIPAEQQIDLETNKKDESKDESKI